MADQIRKFKPRAVFSLGDAFHNPEVIDVPTLYGASIGFGEVRDACKEVGCEFYIVEGNHDINSETPIRISSAQILQGFGTVISELFYIDLDEFTIGVVPFYSNPGKMYSLLQEAQITADLILTHIDVAGCKYENNHDSESDLDPNFNVPVISGDIHLRQEIGSVIYPGSNVQQRFSRSDLDGVGGPLFYDLQTKKPQYIMNTYSKHYVKATSIEDVKNFDPESVVVQLVTDLPVEDVEKELEGYDYVRLPLPRIDEGMEVEYESSGIESPELILRNFISSDNPEALKQFDETLKTNEKEVANA